MTTEQNPKATATQEVEALIAHYQSIENKRKALMRALEHYPEDPRFSTFRHELTNPEFIRRAVQNGVFINYSPPDDLFALELAVHLHDMGIKVWMDMIEIEANWDQEVEQAMSKCGLMISVLSPQALANPTTRQEREQFQRMGKLVLPVVSETCDVQQPHFLLPVVDFSRGFEKGINLLHRFLPAIAEPAVV